MIFPTRTGSAAIPADPLEAPTNLAHLSLRTLAERTPSRFRNPSTPSASISSLPICYRQLRLSQAGSFAAVDFATTVQAQMPGTSTDVMATGMTAALERRLGEIADVIEITIQSLQGDQLRPYCGTFSVRRFYSWERPELRRL
jgi:hypothetical protein